MKSKLKVSRARIASVAIFLALFTVILLCNLLTDLCVDDFTYCYSLSTKEPITSFFQIFPSVAAHGEKLNGRLTAHFLSQLFLWLPQPIFKIANTLVFLAELILIVKIGGKSKHLPIFVLFSFFSLWLFELSFGQVNFWLDGACNYLWSAAASLLFLYPYAIHFLSDQVISSKVLRVLFVIFGLAVGNFMENSSAATIFTACCLLLAIKFYQKRNLRWEEIGAVIAACIGYICILLAPSELQNKMNDLTLGTLRVQFVAVWEMLSAFWLLILFFVILLVLAYYTKANKNRCIFAVLLALGGLFSHFLLTFAAYYPERCSAFTVVLFTAAVITLLHSLSETSYRPLLCCTMVIIFLLGTYHLVLGLNDIYVTHQNMKENIEIIEESKADGITDISLPIVTPATKYSAIYGLRYLSEDPNDWPNADMAKHYGVSSIVGYDP